MAFDLVRCFFFCSLKKPFTSSSGLIGVPSTSRGSLNPTFWIKTSCGRHAFALLILAIHEKSIFEILFQGGTFI